MTYALCFIISNLRENTYLDIAIPLL